MKIAVYYDLPPGGARTHTDNFVRSLKRQHQVDLFNPDPPIVSGRFMSDCQAIYWSRHEAVRLARQINASYDVVYVTHDRFFQAPWILRYLTIPVLFYCHNPTRSFFEKELGIDPAWPLLNQVYEWFIRHLKKTIEISNAHFAIRIATSSRYMVGYIKKAYGLSSILSYPGIDTQVFRPLDIKKSHSILLVGNDESQKSLRMAVEILSRVPPAIRPILTIASPRTKLSQGMIDFGQSLGVTIKATVGSNPSQMNRLYNRSLLTLSTALREPYGLSIVESLSSGTPVLAPSQGGFRETIKPGVTGYLSPRTAKAMSMALTQMLRLSPSKLHKMGVKGREQVIKKFNALAWHAQLEDVLQKLPKYHPQKNG